MYWYIRVYYIIFVITFAQDKSFSRRRCTVRDDSESVEDRNFFYPFSDFQRIHSLPSNTMVNGAVDKLRDGPCEKIFNSFETCASKKGISMTKQKVSSCFVLINHESSMMTISSNDLCTSNTQINFFSTK